MPEVLIWGLVFIVSLIVLVKSADWFIESAEEIGLALGIPAFLVGLTIVALGTSIPELASSIVAVQKGASEIVVSNVVGSNITNVFLVLGAVLLVGSGKVLNLKLKAGDAILLIATFGWLAFSAINDRVFTMWEAIVCLIGILLYVGYQYRNYLQAQAEDDPSDNPPFRWKSVLMLCLSIVGIYFSAEYNIESIIKLSEILEVGKEIISLSAVALGTSLPELFVSMTAVKKGNLEIAIGNIMGSNILNILAVMGIPGMLGNLAIPELIVTHCLPLLAVATIALLLVVYFRKLRVWSGVGLLLLYGYFFYILVSHNMIG